MQLVDDKLHAYGMTILTDDGPKMKDFSECFGCLLYTFPLGRQRRRSDKLVLSTIKMREKYELLTSTEMAGK